MFIMSVLKFIFMILICVPIICLMLYLLIKMIDEVLKNKPKKKRRKNNTQNRSMY